MATKQEILGKLNKVLDNFTVVGLKLNNPGFIDIILHEESRQCVASVKLDKTNKILDLQVNWLEPYKERGRYYENLTRPQVKMLTELLEEKFWPSI